MDFTKIELIDGLCLTGDDGTETCETTIEFRELSANDIWAAEDAAESAQLVPGGFQLLISDAKLGRELIRRSIKRIGDIEMPSLKMLSKLSERDLNILIEGYHQFNGYRSQKTNEALNRIRTHAKK